MTEHPLVVETRDLVKLYGDGAEVRALDGVAVDIRRGSPTFGRWVGFVLSGENFRQLYIPPGFAHGFCVTSETAVVEYKCTDFYDPGDEIGILWNDPTLAVAWPIRTPILSAKRRKPSGV